MPAFQPYRGKPAVRNDRGDRGNVGIIRSPLRASILPDHALDTNTHETVYNPHTFSAFRADVYRRSGDEIEPVQAKSNFAIGKTGFSGFRLRVTAYSTTSDAPTNSSI